MELRTLVLLVLVVSLIGFLVFMGFYIYNLHEMRCELNAQITQQKQQQSDVEYNIALAELDDWLGNCKDPNPRPKESCSLIQNLRSLENAFQQAAQTQSSSKYEQVEKEITDLQQRLEELKKHLQSLSR